MEISSRVRLMENENVQLRLTEANPQFFAKLLFSVTSSGQENFPRIQLDSINSTLRNNGVFSERILSIYL